MNRAILIIIIVLLVVVGLVFAFMKGMNSSSYSSSSSPTQGSNMPTPGTNMNPNTAIPNPAPPVSNTPTSQTASNEVDIRNFAFNPANLSVSVGTKVTWTNHDNVPHTVTGDNGSPSSSQIMPGQSYSFTFAQAGTFTYHCSIHPMMKASIVVR